MAAGGEWEGDTPIMSAELCPKCGEPLAMRPIGEPTEHSHWVLTRRFFCIRCGYQRREGE
jgi:C4-type Zn-finger protein